MTTRDLKLRSCMNAFGNEQLPPLKTSGLASVAEAYKRNIRRLYSLVLFAPAAVWMATVIQRHTVTTDLRFSKKDQRTRTAITDQAVKAEIAKHKAIYEKGGPQAQALLDHQHELSFFVLGAQNPEFHDGPEAWMASQIIASWTAFEAMAGDLWEASLNIKPATLAKLAGRSKSARHPIDDARRIKLDWLHKYQFDLSKVMGTIFLEEKRHSFDSLDGIREAYNDAFSEDGDIVKSTINAKALDAISLIRNNLVHNGGIIDAPYLKRSADLPTEALGQEGTAIQIDGALVAKVIGPTIELGNTLLTAVDEWLDTH